MSSSQARELPIIISAKNETAQAAQAAADQIRKVAASVNAANGASGSGGAGGGVSGSFSQLSNASSKRLRDAMDDNEKSFREQAKEIRSTFRLIRQGAGAFLALTFMDRVAQSAADTLKEYRENIKAGIPTAQALRMAMQNAIPVYGAIMKAGNDLGLEAGHLIFGKNSQIGQEETAADEQQRREARQKLREDNDRRQGGIKQRADEAAQAANDELRMAGTRGPQREVWEARLAREKALRAADAIATSAGGLSNTKDQDRVRAQAALARQAAESEFQDKLNEIDRKGSEESINAYTESREKMKDLQHDANQDHLQQQGQFVAARLDQINREYEKETLAIQQKQLKEQKDLAASDPRSVAAGRIAAQELDAASAKRDADIAKAQDANSEENKREQERKQQGIDRERTAQKTLHDEQMGAFRAAAASGDKNLERQEKIQEILSDRKEKLEQINELEHKAGVTAAQVSQFEQSKKYLDTASRIQLLEASRREGVKSFASAVESRGTTGAGDLLRARLTNRTDPVTEEIKKLTAQMDKQPDEFWDKFISKYPQIAATINANGGTSADNFWTPPNR